MKFESGIKRVIEKDEHGRVVGETFFDEIRNVKLIAFSYTYKADGKPEKEIHDDGFGNFAELLYWYSEDGKYFAFRETEFDKGRRSFCFFKEYYYNDNGKKKKESEVWATEQVTTEYIYDDNARLIKSICSEDQSECKFEYDDKGNMVQQTDYAPDGKIVCVTRFTYDESGKLILKEECSGNNLRKTYTYSYDGKGFRIKEIIKYFIEKNVEVYFVEHNFTNDDTGRVIRSKGKSSDFAETVYFYNEAGRLVVTDLFNEKEGQYFLERYVNFGRDERIFERYQYEYDANGNCVSLNIHRMDGT